MIRRICKTFLLVVLGFSLLTSLFACNAKNKPSAFLSDNNTEIGRYAGLQNDGDVSQTFPVLVMGKGVEPDNGTQQQKQLLASRAAVVDAYRNLSERIAGLVVDSYTRQGNFVVSEDRILSETNSYLRGARVVDVTREEGITTATVKILLPKERFLWYQANLEVPGDVVFDRALVVPNSENLTARPYVK